MIIDWLVSYTKQYLEQSYFVDLCLQIYLIYIYKEDLALNNLQCLICPKNQPNQIIYI